MLGDKLLDCPPTLVAAAITLDADGRHLAVVLEEGERDIPSFVGLVRHARDGRRKLAACGWRERKARRQWAQDEEQRAT